MKHRTRSEWIFLAVASIGLTAGSAFCARPEIFPTEQETHYRKLLIALRDRQASAVDLAKSYRENYANDPCGLWLVAEAAKKTGDHQSAIEAYRQLPQDGGQLEFQRELGLGQRYFSTGDLMKSEKCLRRAIELNPFHLEANNQLGHLLQICGRVWESNLHFFRQIQRGKCRGDELLGMSPTDRFFRYDERLTRMGQETESPALVIRLAEARTALFENREAEAEGLFREILAAYPQLGEAQGRLGRIIVDRGDLSEFLIWRGSLSEDSRQHPEVWFAEGLQAKKIGQISGAVHCFLKVLEFAPNHLGTYTQISSCLDQLGKPELAKLFSQRGAILSEVDRNYNVMRSAFTQQTAMDTVEMLGQLGRFWEAAGWCFVMTNLDDPLPRSREELLKWQAKSRNLPSQHTALDLPTSGLKIADFESPRWPRIDHRQTIPTEKDYRQINWNFSNDAEKVGIQFQYFDGTTRENRLTHIFNTTGGGIGSIDIDGDGWIDLYLAQGNDWRNPSLQPNWIDRCFRNMNGLAFQDVTIPAGLNETGYSQGVTVGDFNQDGFSDLYVGNLGANRLYRNNGDGTFSDCTVEAGVAGAEWSTSSVFADFTGDGLPDLYVLNYSVRKETAEKDCPTSDGVIKACTPDLLKAEHDRCYVNLGDGRFRDVSEESGILVPDGRGLGVIAWDFAGEGRLSLFVANDTSANFLFQNQGVSATGAPQFRETALISGVALDNDGNAQACMGVAAGDANGDGRLDLHITNFFADSNTLYLGDDSGYFTDQTRRYRLREPSFWMLGFGCQFADFDGDRWEDLVVTNGHVDQVSSSGTEDHMRPQLYRNVGGKHFEDIAPDRLGEFFHHKYLGRGLTILDWNRDGRLDFSISHLHSPFALISNQTPSAGRPLIVRLSGRRRDREAIGARLTARVGNESTHRFMSAGSGYLVSNERMLHVCWPGAEKFDELVVRWPDQHEQSWRNVASGQEIMLLEDREVPIVLKEFKTDLTETN